MPPARRALVIGGSIGGLFAAHLLRRAGWDAVVFERSGGDLSDRGAGLGISAELLDAMRRVGLRIGRSLAFNVRRSIWLDQHGGVGCEIRRGWFGSAWPIVYQPLRASFPNEFYRTGKTLERVEQDGRTVTALFADGTSETGDLLVAADGIFSTVRRQYLPEVAPRPAGYVAWRGMIAERDLPAAAHRALMDCAAFSLPEGELVVSLPVPGADNDTRAGQQRYYFIWYRPADAEAQAALFTDASGRSHGVSIPPPLIRPEFVRDMRLAARANLPAMIADIVERVPQPLLQSVSDLESPQLVFGRVALLGDCAFVARPHVAAGTTKAALDAIGLTEALSAGDLEQGLARYDRERRDFGRAIIEHSRYLGAYLETRGAVPRDPERLLREYGAPHLVHDVDEACFDDSAPA